MKSYVIGAAVFVVLIIGAWFASRPGPENGNTAGDVAVTQPEANVAEEVAAAPEPEATPAPDAAEVAAVEAHEEAPEAADALPVPPSGEPIDPDPVVPEFDVVRVSPGGSAVIAGRAEPGASVSLLVGGEEQARAQADASGNFVMMMDVGTADVPRVLSLSSKDNGYASIASEQTVIVAPDDVPAAGGEEAQVAVLSPENQAPQNAPEPATVAANDEGAAETAPEAVAAATTDNPDAGTTNAETAEASEAEATPVASDAASEQVADAPIQAEASAPEAAEVVAEAPQASELATPSAPTVLLADNTGITVLQDGGAGPSVSPNVSIDSISYDAAGEVVLGGRATAEQGFVRVYLDNAPILTTDVGTGGQWRTGLPEVDEGVYTLRVDQLDEGGEVVSRMETPFKREPVEAIAALEAEQASQADQAAPVNLVTVQPGFTLWGISRAAYGQGILYVRIFEANNDRIRNPDLIYPGQIFSIPQ